MKNTVLDTAKELIYETRVEEYGHPKQSMQDIATAWSFVTGFSITPKQVCMMLTMMKLVREKNSPTGKMDNIVDAIGYLGLIERISEPEETPAKKAARLPEVGEKDVDELENILK